MNASGKDFDRHLSFIRHELRSPLNAIIGYTEMLIEQAEDSGNGALIPDLKKVHDASLNLLERIGSLLTFTLGDFTQEKGDATEPGASESIAQTVDRYRREQRKAKTEAKPNIPDLSCVTVPNDLYQSMQKAVTEHNMTELKQCLDEIDTLGKTERQLGACLRTLSRTYDMKAIADLLNKVRHD